MTPPDRPRAAASIATRARAWPSIWAGSRLTSGRTAVRTASRSPPARAEATARTRNRAPADRAGRRSDPFQRPAEIVVAGQPGDAGPGRPDHGDQDGGQEKPADRTVHGGTLVAVQLALEPAHQPGEPLDGIGQEPEYRRDPAPGRIQPEGGQENNQRIECPGIPEKARRKTWPKSESTAAPASMAHATARRLPGRLHSAIIIAFVSNV